jgi:hypothetical protein
MKVRFCHGAMRVDAQGHRDVVDLGIGEQASGFDFPGVQHLAAQRQDGLGFLVARHLWPSRRRNRPRPGTVRFRQCRWIRNRTACLAARQRRTAFAFRPSARSSAAPAPADRELGDGLAGLHVLVEPDLEGIAHHARYQLDRFARVELFLDLALELRIKDARREHEGHAAADIILLQLDAARQQRAVLDEGLHGLEDAGAQAGFMGAAGHGRDQVDVGLGGDGIDMPADAQAAPSPGRSRHGRHRRIFRRHTAGQRLRPLPASSAR